MKVKKLNGYAPDYPAKSRITVKAGVIAAAAVLTAGAAIGCVAKPQIMGDFPADNTEIGTEAPEPTVFVTDEPMLEGEPAVDETEPADDTLCTPGVPLTAPPTDAP